MTTQTTSPPRRIGLPTHLAALTHILAMGVIGAIWISLILSMFAAGISTLLAVVGAFFLLAFIYLLFAASWAEHERVEGLYRWGIPSLGLVPSVGPGFANWLRTQWARAIDGRTWRGASHMAITTVLGWFAIGAAAGAAGSLAFMFTPLTTDADSVYGWFGVEIGTSTTPWVGLAGLLVGAGILVAAVALHAVLARAILVPSREAELLAEARASRVQRAGAVRASELERTRIERDLHDGVQPRLVSVAMTLGMAQQKLESDPAGARQLVDEAHTSTKAAITELRQLARGIHASVLDDRGLDAALSALAARAPIPVTLDVRLDRRCSATAEAAVYFAVAESLTNAAKHSRGTDARVVIRSREAAGTKPAGIWARVEDNGIGGARVLAGGGLDGIANRVVAAGGSIRLDSPNGGPTALEVSVPCAS